MARRYDTIVLGGSIDALAAAITLARRGSKIALLIPENEAGAELRQIEFLPGFRASPLGRDLGWVPKDILALSGLDALPRLAPDPMLVAFGEGGPLAFRRDPQASAQAIAALSPRDGARWLDFCRESEALAGFLAHLYGEPPLRIDADSREELLAAFRDARRFRKLGRQAMPAFLYTLPAAIADLLDDWFETPLLKGALAALAVRDLCQGPRSGGTGFNWLHRQAGAGVQGFIEGTLPQGGAAMLLMALMHQARERGVAIQTNATVARIAVAHDAVRGVELAGGEMIEGSAVISALDPSRTLLNLIDPVHLEAETIQSLRRIRYRAATSIALLALERLPALPELPAAPTGSFLFAPNVTAVERAYDATKYGQISDAPVVELTFPSVADPALAPVGRHVAVLRVQYTPSHVRGPGWDDALRESIGARALRVVESYLPGFGATISGGQVLVPPDLERLFGIPGGAIGGPELALDQSFFMRPFPEAARYAAPVNGLFLCGPATHPGPGIQGISGQLAARRLLRERRTRWPRAQS